MAKIVSQKREMVTPEERKADLGEMRSTPLLTAVGVFFVAIFVVASIAMVLMAFNYQP